MITHKTFFMKFHWGTGLISVFIVFSIMMGYLVYQCTKTKFDLVSKDYYKDELAYQEVIDGSINAASLSVKLKLDVSDSLISFVFPRELRSEHLTGKLWVYCPSDEKKDRKMNFDINPGEGLSISRSQLAKGRYTVKLFWFDGQRHFYNEQPVEF